MIVLFKNRNANDELYYGTILTSPENFNAQKYMDVTNCKSLKTKEQDWKEPHIQSIREQDCVAIYDSIKSFIKYQAEHFI